MALGSGQLSLVEQTVGWTDRKVNEVYLTLRLLVEYVTSNPHTREDNVPDFGKMARFLAAVVIAAVLSGLVVVVAAYLQS